MTGKINSYAMIGDCETAALVGIDGSVDWLCWPRFDSDSAFAAIVGDEENGRWLIAPKDEPEKIRRRYREHTLILETEFTTATGTVTITDFMPLRIDHSDLVRIVRCTEGTVDMRMDLVIRFGYGRIIPWVRRMNDGEGHTLIAIAGPDMVVLRSPVPTHGEDMHTCSEFTIKDGETLRFVLVHGESHRNVQEPFDIDETLERTAAFWNEWAERSIPELGLAKTLGRDAEEAVVRSLVTLKALTYKPTGGIVAAPTTSLPEKIGGGRNWDYRYCWIRDATLSLLAFMDAGYFDEAEAWRDWLLRAVAGSPEQLQIMYGVAGERRLTEWEVPWLSGYHGSLPVRIGNGAYDQLQIDVFGEIIDALYQAQVGGIEESQVAWAMQCALVERLGEIWREPDNGLWEIRSERQHFTHSKIMSWVAVDRAIRSVEAFGVDGPIERWRKVRADIHDDVCANGYDEETGAFVQAYGSKALDASLLLIPTLGFLPSADPRFRSTVEAIEQRLSENGLIHRYDTEETDDGVGGKEGAFLACSFWMADAYAMLGRTEDARRLFDRLVGLSNDVGLLSEEYDPWSHRELGNFPQAFSHVALVHTALRLANIVSADERKPTEGRQRVESGLVAS